MSRLDHQLEELDDRLIQMASACEEMIQQVMAALEKQDGLLAKKVQNRGDEIDQREQEVEALCLRIILHQQPVAGDLRHVTAALKLITDLERIGDQAEDIAEIIGYLPELRNGHSSASGLDLDQNWTNFPEKRKESTGAEYSEDIRTLIRMAHAARDMVTESIDSFVRKNVTQAQAVIDNDDVVDDLFSAIKKTLIQRLSKHPEQGERALDILMIAKYFERIGDHATNIAEWVCYANTGVHPKDVSETRQTEG